MEDEKRRTEDISASKKKDADEIKRLKADKEGLSREVDELKDAVNKVGSVVSSSYTSFDSFLSLFIFLKSQLPPLSLYRLLSLSALSSLSLSLSSSSQQYYHLLPPAHRCYIFFSIPSFRLKKTSPFENLLHVL